MSETFSGTIVILDKEGQEVFKFDSQFALLDLGAGKNDGDLRLHGNGGETKIHLDGGRMLISMANAAGKETIKLDGAIGDITLGNGDVAEEFEVAGASEVLAGSLMVLGSDGNLVPCSAAYDRRVIGVVSGAAAYRPGIVLDRRKDSFERRVLISVLGKVVCRADSTYAPIEVGDLLTTSPTPGHAMKASNPGKAFGAVIGKALRPLECGVGLIPILIALT